MPYGCPMIICVWSDRWGGNRQSYNVFSPPLSSSYSYSYYYYYYYYYSPSYSPSCLCVSQVFDAISYCKGSSVVNMVCALLGKDKFREGLQLYMKRHAYGNTETVDLWNAWSEVRCLICFPLKYHDVTVFLSPSVGMQVVIIMLFNRLFYLSIYNSIFLTLYFLSLFVLILSPSIHLTQFSSFPSLFVSFIFDLLHHYLSIFPSVSSSV